MMATASETSLAALAAAPAPADRKQCLVQSWRYASLFSPFCHTGHVVIGWCATRHPHRLASLGNSS